MFWRKRNLLTLLVMHCWQLDVRIVLDELIQSSGLHIQLPIIQVLQSPGSIDGVELVEPSY